MSMNDRRVIRFAVILSECFREVAADEVPDWLREELPVDELNRIAREAGLPEEIRDELLATALALDKALQAAAADCNPRTRDVRSTV